MSTLRGGIVGQVAMLASTIGIQLVAVPVYVSSLGAETYGTYLVIIAVPAALVMTDLGLLNASSTLLTRLIATAREGAARAVSRFTSTVLTIVIAVALVPLVIVTFLVPHSGPGIDPVSGAVIFLAYCAWVFLCLVTSLYEGSARASGDYPTTWLAVSAFRIVDFTVAAVIVATTQNLPASVLAMCATRLIENVLLRLRLRRRAPWARFLLARPDRTIAAELARPMIGAALQPFAFAVLLQGTVIVVGVALGPVAVVALTAVRTLSYGVRQVASVFIIAGLPRLTMLLARGEHDEAGRFHRGIIRIVALASLTTGALVVALGPVVLPWWTAGAVEESAAVLAVFVAQALLDTTWLVLGMPLLARNAHLGFSVVYAVGAVLALTALALIGPESIVEVPLLQSLVSIAVIAAVVISTRRFDAARRGESATGSPRPR
jgi:O-antigen/teichoic acid export membrane protein